MADKFEILTWKCDACAESEGRPGLPCTLTSAFLPEKSVLHCPISCEECDWEIALARQPDTELEAFKSIAHKMYPKRMLIVDGAVEYAAELKRNND